MKFTSAFITLVGVVLTLAPTSVLAADCGWASCPYLSLPGGGTASESTLYAAREWFCNRNPIHSGYYGDVAIFVTQGSVDRQLCWDALANIINQCKKGGASSGKYSYNGVSFNMGFCVGGDGS